WAGSQGLLRRRSLGRPLGADGLRSGWVCREFALRQAQGGAFDRIRARKPGSRALEPFRGTGAVQAHGVGVGNIRPTGVGCPVVTDLALSVLDLVPVRTDQTTTDAVRASLRLARTADELGYRRYWVAEHHNMPAVAATNPPVLIGMIAAATERIRVGSGGVMLPNHAPLVVAEHA